MHMTSFNLEFVFSVLVLYQVKIIKFSIKCHCYDHKTSQQCKVIQHQSVTVPCCLHRYKAQSPLFIVRDILWQVHFVFGLIRVNMRTGERLPHDQITLCTLAMVDRVLCVEVITFSVPEPVRFWTHACHFVCGSQCVNYPFMCCMGPGIVRLPCDCANLQLKHIPEHVSHSYPHCTFCT